MDREKLDGWCETGILGLVLLILVGAPLLFGGADTWHFLPLQGLTMLVMALWIARFWISPRFKLLWTPICWVIPLFVIYAAVRYFQADIEYPARKEFIHILVYAFLFYAVLNNLHRQETIRVIAVTTVVLGMVLSFYACYQYFTGAKWVYNTPNLYPGRATGTFVNPNNFAAFLELILPLGFCYILAGRLSHLSKILIGYASFSIMVGIAVTLSRGGWAGAAISLMLLCGVLLLQPSYRLKALVFLIVLLGIAYYGVPRMKGAMERFDKVNSAYTPNELRFSVWRSAFEMWQDNVWVGVGPGLFDYRFRAYRTLDMQRRPDLAHNDYLNTLADYGVVGLAIVLLALAALFVGAAQSWKYVRGSSDDFARKRSSKFAFMVGALLGITAMAVHCFVDFNMHIPADAILAVTFMALVTSQLRFSTERYWFSAGTITKIASTAILAGGIGVLGVTGFQSAQENACLSRARSAPLYTYAQIDLLKAAYEVESANFDTTYAIAECYRTKSLEGTGKYAELAIEAIEWYKKGIEINPHEPYNWLGCGLCLDWLGPKESPKSENPWSYYKRANELDPNGQFTTAKIGWHFLQIGDYAAARTWFERSKTLEPRDNDFADGFLPLTERRLAEAAGNQTK